MSKKKAKSKKMEWFPEDDPVSEDAVRKVGEQLGVDLPESYVKIASQFNGGCPDDDIFDAPGRPECVFDYLLSIPDGLSEFIEDTEDRMPKSILPFATDPFGNAICFDYRQKGVPKIVFWDHEAKPKDTGALLPLSDNFGAFVDSLYSL